MPSPSPRTPAIDVVRGLAMVIMALDHVRDMLTSPVPGGFDFAHAGLPLFATRWVTHLCAPTFVLLAGTGAYLYGAKGRSRGEVARFLLGRGAWLVLAEVTIVNLAWNFNVGPRMVLALQVIWAIGCSMVALSGLVWLPLPAVAAIGAAMVVGHNLLDGVQPPPSAASPVWTLLHMQGPLTIGGTPVAFVGYPLVPWLGVMALGYVLGSLYVAPEPRRPRRLVGMGMVLVAAFLALRIPNAYGEPNPWTRQPTLAASLVDFLNVTKYPPSLQFLLVTLGAALILLGLAEGRRGTAARALATLGRVPFFYYVLHLYVIHALAVVVGLAQGFPLRDVAVFFFWNPPGFGLGLAAVYAVWVATVAALFPACAWFAGVKARRRDWWLSYL